MGRATGRRLGLAWRRPRLCSGRGQTHDTSPRASSQVLRTPDHIFETVRIADRAEGLSASDHAGAGQRIKRGDGKLRISQREPSLVAEPCVAARGCSLEPPRLLVEGQPQR
jgi:hypothetical protein